MLTWVIVKTKIDSSLNLYEHCVAGDDENNCPAGPALRGQPCGAAYSHILSPKMASAGRTAPFYQHKCVPKAKQALFGVFDCTPEKYPF